MKKYYRKVAIILLVLVLIAGCSKKETPTPDDKVAVDDKKGIPTNLEMASSSILLTEKAEYIDDNTILLQYNVSSIAEPEGTLRLFALVDGYISELAVNGDNFGLYQDIEGTFEESLFNIKIKPSHSGQDNEMVNIMILSMPMTSAIDFYDSLWSYYIAKSFGASASFEMKNYIQSNQKFIGQSSTRKLINEDFDPEGIDTKQTYLENIEVNSFSTILISSSNEYFLRQGMDGLKYDSNEQYSITKIGVGDYFVYPLLNGEFMYENGEMIAYILEESDSIDDITYYPLNLQSYNLKKGDIISLLMWDTTDRSPSGVSYIVVE